MSTDGELIFYVIRLTRRNTRTDKSQFMCSVYFQICSVSSDFFFVKYVWPCHLSGKEGEVVVDLSHRRPEFEPRVVHVGFMMNKVVPAHLSLRNTSGFHCQNHFNYAAYTHFIYLPSTL